MNTTPTAHTPAATPSQQCATAKAAQPQSTKPRQQWLWMLKMYCLSTLTVGLSYYGLRSIVRLLPKTLRLLQQLLA